MSAATLTEQIINQALVTAQQKADAATAYANQAITTAQGFANGVTTPVVFEPGSIEPPVNIPMNASGIDTALYGSTYDKIIADLSGQFAGFFAQFFPSECNYIAEAQDWICKALTDGGTGINAHVEDQIWQRDRARVLQEVDRASEETLATFAARRFPVPPGAAQHQLYIAQQAAQDKIAQASRDVAIKQIELEIENVKFAVQQALEFRIKSVAAAAEYIRALALGPEIASRLAISAASAQANLISAASSYYNARIRIEEIKLDVKKTNALQDNQMMALNVQEFGHRLGSQVQVMSAAAQAQGNQAAAALNALHSSVQIAVQGETA